MKLAEVYQLPIKETLKGDISQLMPYGAYHNVFPELENMPSYDSSEGLADPLERVELRVHAEHWQDFRRFWRLWTVWHDGKPVMVCQNAGREGDDYQRRYITDPKLYEEALLYVRSLIPIRVLAESERAFTDESLDIGDALTFYGQDLRAPS